MTITTRLARSGSGALCRSLLAELPEWFGIPEANANYEQTADTDPVWIAYDREEPVGLMILKPHADSAVENWLLAARRARRPAGIGRALIAQAEQVCAERGAAFLTVKTLGPSHPSPEYAETRAFYRAVGFTPLEEFESLWGPENPCLFLVKPVAG